MKAARVDDNQKAITRYLRDKGAIVTVTSSMGRGFPDLVVGYKGKNILLELKDGSKSPSEQKLTAEQIIFHSTWKGQIAVVNSPEAAWIEVLTHIKETEQSDRSG